jgi:hypothetical protein
MGRLGALAVLLRAVLGALISAASVSRSDPDAGICAARERRSRSSILFQSVESQAPMPARVDNTRHGDVLTAISDGMVGLLKEFYGRGPTRAKTYFEDDLVVCLLRRRFSRVEQTLLEGGRGSWSFSSGWISRI